MMTVAVAPASGDRLHRSTLARGGASGPEGGMPGRRRAQRLFRDGVTVDRDCEGAGLPAERESIGNGELGRVASVSGFLTRAACSFVTGETIVVDGAWIMRRPAVVSIQSHSMTSAHAGGRKP